MLCGDFNMIYGAVDKNNARLNRRVMNWFRRFLDDLELSELHLNGRLFTWSNEREHPTLERIDRVFVTVDWLSLFPDHWLRALSSDCSDHAPLLLQTCCVQWAKRRFRFESIWPKFNGFLEAVAEGWDIQISNADPCRVLDCKLRNVAKALKSWSSKFVGNIRLQLALAREIILQFDIAQESRPLCAEDLLLRKQLKVKCLGLASLARTVARQRSRLIFLEAGDANTKFFQLQACHRSRRNFIQEIQVDGMQVVLEEAKAEAFYNYFFNVFGQIFPRTHSLRFDLLGLRVANLDGLDACFSEEEVWAVVRELPDDKAPGPDGFTGLFYKMAWSVIKNDVMNVSNALWSLDLRSLYLLNDAYIVLLKKKDDAAELKDFRPISLIHSLSKLITKLLAVRLAPKLDSLISPNQSAFIKARCIHDNFQTVQLTCKLLHKKKLPSVLLKIDLARAFDSVAWPFLLEVLEFLGFSRRWRDWIAGILSTSSTKILVNGRPGKRIFHVRGLRQGDPLSPMLFVIVMEMLSGLISFADRAGFLTNLQLPTFRSRAFLYADDLVIFVAPKQGDLSLLKSMLDIFAGASGLCTNLSKCSATPIACTPADTNLVLAILGCRLSTFPCTYLGVPLSIKRAIHEIEKLRRSFLWTGSAISVAGHCKVAWETVCRPIVFGGLGVSNLHLLGIALRVRWCWLQRTDPTRLWAELPSFVEPKVRDLFRAGTEIIIGDGRTTLFWVDNWLDGLAIDVIAPNLMAAVSPRRRIRTVRDGLLNGAWISDIRGVLDDIMIAEYIEVWERIRHVSLSEGVPDQFRWRWTLNGIYTSSSAYQSCFFGSTMMLGAKFIWKSKVPPKVKFFAWLAALDRCWTAVRRHRHGLQDSDTCALCDQESECINHLLLRCSFAREVWFLVLRPVSWHSLIPGPMDSMMSWWSSARKRVHKEFRKGFDALVLLSLWMIWKERNARVFGRRPSSPSELLSLLLSEANLWVLAGFRALSCLVALIPASTLQADNIPGSPILDVI
ncbi:hypothetical protein U9M48_037868 [Paspalum notatum var. saurae]|uniref:Reverse transcriptase domain-containing protein n=1 Tax=Paspalum notatum var. saurae TaxID=547442 RepID=A0AAQ3XB47_PASNO